MMNPPAVPTKTEKGLAIVSALKYELRGAAPAIYVIVGVLLGYALSR